MRKCKIKFEVAIVHLVYSKVNTKAEPKQVLQQRVPAGRPVVVEDLS